MGKKSAQRQFLVKVKGIDEYFMTKSGGDISASTSKVYDGGKLIPDVISSPAEASDITITRGYDAYRDAPVLARLRNQVSSLRTTLSVAPTNEDLQPIGEPVTYPEALLVGINEPEVNASSGDSAVYSLMFAVGQWA